MGKRRRNHSIRAAMIRWHGSYERICPRKLAFATIVEGARPTQIRKVLEWMDVELPSKRETETATKKVCDLICKMAEENMQQELERCGPNTVIAFDGSWDHRRGGKQCLFSVASCATGKIIDAKVISKAIARDSEEFCEQSNMMESKGLSLVIEDLRHNPNIVGYVHDNDGRARNMIRLSGWEIHEYLDPNHALKSFESKLQNFNSKNANILRGVEGSLRKWLYTLLASDYPTEFKKIQWLNCYNHYCGDHRYCLHGNGPTTSWEKSNSVEAKEAFKKFLLNTLWIIEKVDTRFSTQLIESLHRTKLKFACKDVKWGYTWKARMMAAILEHNLPGWKYILRDRLSEEEFQQVPEILGENQQGPDLPVLGDQDQMVANILEDLINELEQIQRGEVPLAPYRRNPYNHE